jgi:hypothetical protein
MTATGTGKRLRVSGLGAAAATVGWPPWFVSTSIVGNTNGTAAALWPEAACAAFWAHSTVSKPSVRGGKKTTGPSNERRQIGHSGTRLCISNEADDQTARRAPKAPLLQGPSRRGGRPKFATIVGVVGGVRPCQPCSV